MTWDEWRGNGKPAMWIKRLFEFGGWRVDLHKFVAADDPECYHTHPANCWRIILWGGYTEEFVCESRMPAGYFTREKTWRPGMIGLVRPEYTHRIDSLRSGPSYSLWIRGPICAEVTLFGWGWPKGAQPMSKT